MDEWALNYCSPAIDSEKEGQGHVEWTRFQLDNMCIAAASAAIYVSFCRTLDWDTAFSEYI